MISFVTILTFSVFLIVFLGVGAFAARLTQNTEKDYLLGNRSFGRFFIGLSAGATGNSGFIMVAGVGIAYTMGASSLLMIIAAFIGEYIYWTFIADKVSSVAIERDSETVPELLGTSVESNKGKKVITSLVAIILTVLVGAYAAAQFAAAAKSMNVFFGTSDLFGVSIAAVLILAYCVKGGLRASIWTDIVQAGVVGFVTVGMFLVALSYAGGIGAVVTSLREIDPALVNLTAGFTLPQLIAYIIGFVVLGIGFGLTQPQVLVRLLAGRDPKEVKTAKWVYLGYVYITWGAMALFGIVCRVLLPDLGDPEQALPIFAMENFNPFLLGLVLAGLFSVIASTADSQILVVSSAVARDISPSLYHKMMDRFGIRYQQVVTLLVGLVAAFATLTLSTSVFSLVLFAIGALAGSVGPAMIITVFRRPTNEVALCLTMIFGLVVSVVWRMMGYHDTLLNETVPAMVGGLLFHQVVMALVFNQKEELVTT